MRVYTEEREYTFSRAHESAWLRSCFYCGEPASGIDHVPPSSVRGRVNGSVELIEIDCCKECNSALATVQSLWTLNERKAFIAKWLVKRYAELLKTPNWSRQDLLSLRPKLRKRIRASLRKRDLVRSRLEWAKSK